MRIHSVNHVVATSKMCSHSVHLSQTPKISSVYFSPIVWFLADRALLQCCVRLSSLCLKGASRVKITIDSL